MALQSLEESLSREIRDLETQEQPTNFIIDVSSALWTGLRKTLSGIHESIKKISIVNK